jgi:hypothetical protein
LHHTGIAAASPSQVMFLCAGDGAAGSIAKEVLSSSDGGLTVHLAGQAPFQGCEDVGRCVSDSGAHAP